MESITEVQLNNMLRTVGFYEKPDHKVKCFAAFSILESEKKHRVPSQVDREKEEPLSF